MQKRSLYLECCSGISGDMTAAALLDLGVDREALLKALKSLPLAGYEVEISRVKKSGLDACDFNVKLDAAHENHDHDMAYLHGHDHDHEHNHAHVHSHDFDHGHVHSCEHGHEYTHSHGDEHAHEHTHSHGDAHTHAHSHEHRGLVEVRDIISASALTEGAKALALRIFTILGEAEAKAHGASLETVHFHEVGAVDSIVDIAAVAFCLDALQADEVIIRELYEGEGTVRCQHGLLPIPVPAVSNIAAAHGLTLRPSGVGGELVTPTGAAIAAAVRTKDRLPERYRIERIGIGAGKRDYACAGILRAMLLCEEGTGREEEKERGLDTDAGSNSGSDSNSNTRSDVVWKLESNIDDCSGEALSHLLSRLMEKGALDAAYLPLYMKKNRPAWMLTVLCHEEQIDVLEQLIFRETTTIGVRRCRMERSLLKRELRDIETSLGRLRVKGCLVPGEGLRLYPEYESLAVLSKKHGLPYQLIQQQIAAELQDRSAWNIAGEAKKLSQQIDAILKRQGFAVVAIDGMCGAGKSSIAEALRRSYGCSVVHMDDFYLPKELRTEARYGEPGGNVHYERFLSEVAEPVMRMRKERLAANKEGERGADREAEFSYHRFDCSSFTLSKDPVRCSLTPVLLVEGTYALRPEFCALYDLTVFAECSEETQLARILERCGPERLQIFREKWIPLEQAYFTGCGVRKTAAVCIRTDERDPSFAEEC